MLRLTSHLAADGVALIDRLKQPSPPVRDKRGTATYELSDIDTCYAEIFATFHSLDRLLSAP